MLASVGGHRNSLPGSLSSSLLKRKMFKRVEKNGTFVAPSISVSDILLDLRVKSKRAKRES